MSEPIKLTKAEQEIFDRTKAIFKLSDEEIYEMIESDRKIDKGEKLFELPKELEEGAKKARRAYRKPNSTPTHRERKADEDKREIIQFLVDNLPVDNLTIENAEREIIFYKNGRKFKLTLSAPRT